MALQIKDNIFKLVCYFLEYYYFMGVFVSKFMLIRDVNYIENSLS